MPSLLCPPTIAGSDGQPEGAPEGAEREQAANESLNSPTEQISQAKLEREPGHEAASEGAIVPHDAGTCDADDGSGSHRNAQGQVAVRAPVLGVAPLGAEAVVDVGENGI